MAMVRLNTAKNIPHPSKRVGLFLDKDVFAHGQVYVGMSRCGDPDKLFVYGNLDANGERWVAHPV